MIRMSAQASDRCPPPTGVIVSVPYGNSQPPQDPSFQPSYPQGAPGYAMASRGYGAVQLVMLPPELAALPGASFGQSVRRFFRRYAQFGGAASVSEVMWAWLMNILIGLGCIIVGGIAMTAGAIPARDGAGSSAETWTITVTVIYVTIGLIYILAVMVPTIAVMVRRLHDTGKSGGWCFICLVPWIGGIILLILLLMPSRPELFQPEWA